MFDLHRKADLLENQRLSCSLSDMKAKVLAISRSMAIIEFSPMAPSSKPTTTFAG